MTADLPWQKATRQEQGRISERKGITKMGGRVHPMSGAGSIKADGSTDDEVIEWKDANKSYTLKAADLEELRRHAIRQGKDGLFIIQFNDPRLRAVIRIETE